MISKKLRTYISSLVSLEEFDERSDYHANILFSIDSKEFSSSIKNYLPSSKNLNRLYNESATSLLGLDKESKEFLFSLPDLDIKEANSSLLTTNPYYKKLINKTSYKFKDIEFGFSYFYPYVPFLLDEKTNTPNCHSPFGYFSKKIKYPLIKKNGSNWMELVPHEINSMDMDLANAKGNVLVVGLGLGYFAYMASRKKDVTSVTILEKDKDMIDVFSMVLFDEFENKDKIKIINENAFTYKDYPNFDFVYIDIYRDELDGLPIVGKLLNNPNLGDNVSFWFISSLLTYLRRFVITALDLVSSPSFNEKEYEEFARNLEGETNPDLIIWKIYNYLIKPNAIEAKENIDSLLSNESMLGLLKELFK